MEGVYHLKPTFSDFMIFQIKAKNVYLEYLKSLKRWMPFNTRVRFYIMPTNALAVNIKIEMKCFPHVYFSNILITIFFFMCSLFIQSVKVSNVRPTE